MWLQMIGVVALLHSFLIADMASEQHVDAQPLQEEAVSEWQQHCKDRNVKEWLLATLENTSALESEECCTVLPLLHIFECNDKDGRFNRKISPVRSNIEKDILQDLEQVLEKEPKDAPVRLLSLENTGLLQDWYLVGQLIRQGRTNIELTIISSYAVKEAFDGFVNFCDALEAEGISIKLSYFTSLEKCLQSKKSTYHAIYGINFYLLTTFEKGTWKTLALARKVLAPNAHLFVSYLAENIRINALGNIDVIDSSSENKLLRDSIVAAQRKNPRSKSSSLRIQTLSTDPFFYTGPMLYAVSDLFQDGYQDIMLFTNSYGLEGFSETDVSSLFSDLLKERGSVGLQWKKLYYVTDIHEDRRDMIILNCKGIELKEATNWLNRYIVIFRRIVPQQGFWLISGDQIGLWEVDGLGCPRNISPSKEHEKAAKELMSKLFASGGHWR
jgi:hypothetical protein